MKRRAVMPMPKFISVAQCARELGVSESFVRKLIDAGEIEHFRLQGRILIPADLIDKKKENAMTGTSLISRMADRRHMDPQTFYETVKTTLMPANTTKEQLAAFLMVADRYGLDPLTKEIYAFPNRKGTGITPVLSIDGWINLVNSHPQCNGFSFEYDRDDEGRLVSVTCTMHRRDREHPVEVTEFYQENYRATEPWNQMPSRMLRHKAFKECARLAFGFAGIADEDEARDMSGERPDPAKRIDADALHDHVIDALDQFAASPAATVADQPPQSAIPAGVERHPAPTPADREEAAE